MQSLPIHTYNSVALAEDVLAREEKMAGKGNLLSTFDSTLTRVPGEPRTVSPTSSDVVLMQSLGITFGDGHYSIGGYRYGRLSDAVNYARLKAQGIAP